MSTSNHEDPLPERTQLFAVGNGGSELSLMRMPTGLWRPCGYPESYAASLREWRKRGYALTCPRCRARYDADCISLCYERSAGIRNSIDGPNATRAEKPTTESVTDKPNDTTPLPTGTDKFVKDDVVMMQGVRGVVSSVDPHGYPYVLFDDGPNGTCASCDLQRPTPKPNDRVRVSNECKEQRVRGKHGIVVNLYVSGDSTDCVELAMEGNGSTEYVFIDEAFVVKNSACVPFVQASGRTMREYVNTNPSTPPKPTLDQRLIAIGKKYESVIPQIEIMRRVLREAQAVAAADPKVSVEITDCVFSQNVSLIESGDTIIAVNIEAARAMQIVMLCAAETAIAVRDAAKVVRQDRKPARIEPMEIAYDVNGDDDP